MERGDGLAAAAALAAAVALAGCGGSHKGAPDGRRLFIENCGGCHTLAAAGTHGMVGPNLDSDFVPRASVLRQLTYGAGGMPSFRDRLTPAERMAVASFVVRSRRGGSG